MMELWMASSAMSDSKGLRPEDASDDLPPQNRGLPSKLDMKTIRRTTTCPVSKDHALD